MGSLGAPEIIIIAVVLVLLFGAAKLPIFAKSLGESMRIFKKEIKGHDEQPQQPAPVSSGQPQQSPQLPPVLADQSRDNAAPSRETTETR